MRLTIHSPQTGHIYSSPIDTTQPVFSLTETSESKVNSIISSLKNSKSKDIFGLDSLFLKKHATTLTGTITKIINTSFREGKFPKDWKSAIVVPVHKSGDTTDVNNYRPISVLPVMSKISEKCVAEQFTGHLNSGPFTLHPMQFGFRANHSTETANCLLVENIKSKMDKGGIVGAIFLDLKKAFDTVNHQVLIHKMSYLNFSPSAIDWMSSYLSDRVQCVRVSGETSPPLRNELGVPQGSILGPVLFSLYINDLPSVCTGIEVQMYADDTVIYVHAKTKAQAAAKLSDAMVHVHQWLADSQLSKR